MRLGTPVAVACALAWTIVGPSPRASETAARTSRGASPQPAGTVEIERAQRAALPAVMLWAWERPTDLSSTDPSRVGVAYLAGTVTLRGDEVLRQPRAQPLRVPRKTTTLSVVRVEVDAGQAPTLSQAQRRAAVDAVVAFAEHPRSTGLQIDFDATRSQRAFYAALIREVRARLPSERLLSITALASWCMGDPWVAALGEVDEAVPMLFEMGPDGGAIQATLGGGGDFGPAACRGSYGISVDEPIARLDGTRRVYVFSPAGWNARTIAEAMNLTRHVRAAASKPTRRPDADPVAGR